MRHSSTPVLLKQYLSEFLTPVSNEPISFQRMRASGIIRMAVVTPTIFLLTLATLLATKRNAYQQETSTIILIIWLILFVAYIATNLYISFAKRGTLFSILSYGCIVIELSTNQLILYATGSLVSHAVIFLPVLVCIYRVFFNYRISLFAAVASCVLYVAAAILEVQKIIPLAPYLPAPLIHIVYTDPKFSLSVTAAVIFGVLLTFFITNFSMNQVMKLNRYILENLKQEKIKAATDALTGLFNRRSFDDQLQKSVNKALVRSEQLSLIIIDIDDFKKYNDTFGHQAGDEILMAISSVISASIRFHDFAARYGGEEFVVILEQTSSEEAVLIAERIRSSVENLPVGSIKSQVTVSIGISTLPDDCKDLRTLIKHSDDSLYYSKNNGKNRVTQCVCKR
jgi:diguanylate cyclase (GGDEF)-like protein